MYGVSMGTLEFETSSDGSAWDTVWSKSGNQGTSWQLAQISISTSTTINYVRFAGTTGSDYTSDISIDDFSMESAPTSSPTTATQRPTQLPSSLPTPLPTITPTAVPTRTLLPTQLPSPIPSPLPTSSFAPSPLPSLRPSIEPSPSPSRRPSIKPSRSPSHLPTIYTFIPISENFDSGWGSFSNTGSYSWTLNSGSTPSSSTGPTSDHTTGSGYYAYIEASSPNYPSKGPFYLQHDVSIDIGTLSFIILCMVYRWEL
mmetsp:Transcript_19924/g.25984  ORF Transcript_19924/g.25984 Transcript_19924/m.25984 type:complete len:257 (-) Transcript_19924:101-871(-)